MSENVSKNLVSKWLEFSVTDLENRSAQFTIFLDHISELIAGELTYLSQPFGNPTISNGPTKPREPVQAGKPAISKTTPIVNAVKKENEQHKKLKKILEAVYAGQETAQHNSKPGCAQFPFQAEHGSCLCEFATLTKALTPEQVRGFLTETLPKSKAEAGLLISSSGITGAHHLDIFASGTAPVVFISSFPKEPERMKTYVKIADAILRFVMKARKEEGHEGVAKDFSALPHVLHSLSRLLNFIEIQGPRMTTPVAGLDLLKLPEYKVLSLSGGRVVKSTNLLGGGTMTHTTSAPKTVIQRTVHQEPVRTVVQRSGAVNGTETMTQRTLVRRHVRTTTLATATLPGSPMSFI